MVKAGFNHVANIVSIDIHIMNKLAITAISIAVLVLGFGAYFSTPLSQVQAEETAFPSREKTISVTGEATSMAKPDLLVITFGVENQETTAKEALDANSVSMNQIVTAIKSTGIPESQIGTAQFNIYPVYESYEDKETGRWTQKLVGYRVTNTITVKTPSLDAAPAIIDGAVGAGANRVDSVYFTLSPQKQIDLKDNLIKNAVLNAKKKAETALSPLDHQIIGVKAVNLSEYGVPPPVPLYKSYDMAVAEGAYREPTPIFSSDQEIRTTANVIFLIGSN